MKILSVRRGFLADHSSTSYEFLAVDRPLDSKARAAVSRLSSRVQPTTRKASFIYHGDWNDLPGGWGALMAKYYDVMYSESYDWWTLAIAFDTDKKDLVSKICKYKFCGVEDLGVDVSYGNNRVVVTIACRVNPDYLYREPDDEWWDEDEDEELSGTVVATNDFLLDLLIRIRDRLKKGDCQALYSVWETYGLEEGDEEGPEDAPPRPRRIKAGAPVAEEFESLLAPM